jgi:hypothetical protein
MGHSSSRLYLYYIRCDGDCCRHYVQLTDGGAEEPWSASLRDSVARDFGYKKIGKKWLCPECREIQEASHV